MLIAALAIHRYKQAQEKAKKDKTDAAVKEAKDNLDDATGGDPKKTVKDVVAANKEVLPTVQDNIQKNQTLIDNLKELQQDFSNKIEANAEIFTKLEDYLREHPNENPVSPIDDEDLEEAGYKSFADVEKAVTDYRTMRDRLSDTIARFNNTTIRNTSDQNMISNNNNSQENENKLIEE